MDTFRHVFAVLIVAGMPPGVLYWFFVHPCADFWRRHGGPKVVFSVLAVLFVLSGVAVWFFHDALRAGDLGTRWPLVVLGVPFLVVAGVIQHRRKRLLTFRVLAGVPEIDPDAYPGTLLREGIYARIRHPRYVEISLALIGWSLIVNYVAVYVVTALTILILVPLVWMEERELLTRFGDDYAAYRREVPAFIPRPRQRVERSR